MYGDYSDYWDDDAQTVDVLTLEAADNAITNYTDRIHKIYDAEIPAEIWTMGMTRHKAANILLSARHGEFRQLSEMGQ